MTCSHIRLRTLFIDIGLDPGDELVMIVPLLSFCQ